MRIIFAILLFVCVLPFSLSQANEGMHAPRFFEAIPDVPLMNGMQEMHDYIFVFDKPEGRIIETLARTDGISVVNIREYYAQTLPQLGWRSTNHDEFIREEEKLSMQYEEDFLKITIRPKDE